MYSGEAVETGTVKRGVRPRCAIPIRAGLFPSIPLPGADKNARPLVPIPGQLPLPHERPQGCTFGPRCELSSSPGRCDAGRDPDDRRSSRRSTAMRRAACAIDEIDWEAPPAERDRDASRSCPATPVLEVDDLKKYYEIATLDRRDVRRRRGRVRSRPTRSSTSTRARRETVAIVGESGCGKSTFAKVLMGLETATEGEVALGNGSISADCRSTSATRETIVDLQMVFQNPFDTLNPSHSVGAQIARVLREIRRRQRRRRDRRNACYELLDLVKLPRDFATRRPRQLSGGQKQRIGIARAFAGDAKVVVADEPVSALDVSVQAAVTELLMDIQRKQPHDACCSSATTCRWCAISPTVSSSCISATSSSRARTDQVFSPPYHPYTEALLSAVPIADTRGQEATSCSRATSPRR